MKKPRGVPSMYGWVSASVYNSCWRIFARQVGVANSTGVMIFRFTRHDKYIYWSSFSGTVYIVDDAAFKPSKCLATTPIMLDRIPPQKKKITHTHILFRQSSCQTHSHTLFFSYTFFFRQCSANPLACRCRSVMLLVPVAMIICSTHRFALLAMCVWLLQACAVCVCLHACQLLENICLCTNQKITTMSNFPIAIMWKTTAIYLFEDWSLLLVSNTIDRHNRFIRCDNVKCGSIGWSIVSSKRRWTRNHSVQ